MSRLVSIRNRLSVALATTAFLVLPAGSFSRVYAASNLVASGSYDQVTSAEQVFFGKPDTTNTYLRRLELLEIGIFGRIRSGSQEKRFDRIATALGLGTENRDNAQAPTAGSDIKNRAPGVNSSSAPALTGVAQGPGTQFASSQHFTDADSPEHLRKLSDLGSAGLSTTLSKPGEPADADLAAAKAESVKPEQEKADTTKPDLPKSDLPKPGLAKSAIAKSEHAQTDAGAIANSASSSQSKKTQSALKKEPAKLEPLLVHADLPGGDRRLQRPGATAANEAAEKSKEIEELFKKGMADFREKHFGDAQICFKKILVIDPRNVDAYYNLGSMSEAKREYVDALTYYRAALATKPNDNDLKAAVHSMEEELHKQHVKTASKPEHVSANTRASGGAGQKSMPTNGASRPADKSDRYTPEVNVASAQAPISEVSTSDAPSVPVQQVDDKTFSLQTAQNGINNQFGAMNALNSQYQGVPINGVPSSLAGNIPANNTPVRNVTPNSNRNSFNSILSVGAGYALRGSGLHCPICRVLGGMH